jgi:hypothetical protein
MKVSPSTHELERLLRTARPQPRADFVRTLEASLPQPRAPIRAPIRAPRWRVAFAACASAAALVAVATVLGAVGALPFSVGAGKEAKAGQDCQIVFVQRRARVPHVARKRNGDLHVVYRMQMVRKTVKRCR